MRALLIAAAVLLCGTASAQDAGAVCRSFCDADARECREPARSAGWVAADALIHLHGSASVAPDKHEQAADDADRDRRAHSQQCGDARLACRQKCSARAAAPAAASAPDSTASAPN
jgi:hypothetical protein